MRTLAPWALATTLLHGTLALASDPVIVWHALEGAEMEALYEAAGRYEQSSGVPVELIQFQSHGQLYEQFHASATDGGGPDVLFGDHRVAATFLKQGLLGGKCLPGECPACESDNPPSWCAFASNGLLGNGEGSVAELMIPDFAMSPARCLEDGCGECDPSRPVVPAYCKYVDQNLEVDVLQAAFTDYSEDHAWPVPVGAPLWWSYRGVGVDRSRLEVPTDLEQLVSLGQGGSATYDDDDWCPTLPKWPFPWPRQLEATLPASGNDPMPIRDADLLVFPSYRAGELQRQLGDLVVPVVEGFKPELVVQGAFVRAGTERQAEAWGIINELMDPALQAHVFEHTGLLPAHRIALEAAQSQSVEGLVTGGKFGALMDSSPVPIPALY